MNKTYILIGERGFGARESIVDENSQPTQRILVYKGKDGTQISILLGRIITDKAINNNIISLYSDDFKI